MVKRLCCGECGERIVYREEVLLKRDYPVVLKRDSWGTGRSASEEREGQQEGYYCPGCEDYLDGDIPDLIESGDLTTK